MAMSENRTTGRRGVALQVVGCALGLGVLAGCGSSSGGGGEAAGTTSSSSTTTSSASSSTTSSSSSASGGSGMPATATMIMIEDFTYKTPPSVSPGATVSVMNMDGQAHTVTADSGNAFDVTSPAGKTVTFTAPTTPGTYAYHCTYHGNMHGVLVVK
jgi:plastocyanin